MQSGNGNTNFPTLLTDPALSGTLLGAFSQAMDKIIQRLDNRLPATVIAYDRSSNLVSVQIMVPMVTTTGAIIPRSQVTSIPVQVDGAAGLFMSFPLKSGDTGWVEANDRDISLFLQSGQSTKPNTYRKWSFSDGKFTPSVLKGFTINAVDNDAVVISTTDGTIRVSISPTLGVSITSPTLTVNGTLLTTGGLDLQGGVNATPGPSGGTVWNGNFYVQGAIIATGTITPSGVIP
jgi:hypothetical protein